MSSAIRGQAMLDASIHSFKRARNDVPSNMMVIGRTRTGSEQETVAFFCLDLNNLMTDDMNATNEENDSL